MAEASPPSGEAVGGWVGFEVEEVGGARVGRVDGVFVDAESGEPAWLIVALGRQGRLRGRRQGPVVAVPVRECAGAAGRVWTAQPGEALNSAPTVDPTRPLLREHEATICAHYGIGEAEGRCAEVAGRPEATVTARSAP